MKKKIMLIKVSTVAMLGLLWSCVPTHQLDDDFGEYGVPVVTVPTSTTILWDKTAYANYINAEEIPECPPYGSCEVPVDEYIVSLPSLKDLVEEYFEPEHVPLMLRIAFCESSAKPDDKWSDAINRKSGATGWFQHLPKWWEERSYKAGFSGWLAVEPRANVGVAAWLFYHMAGNDRWGGASHWYPSRRCWGGK